VKVLVIGTGAIGIVVASELTKSPEVEEVRVADINVERARRLGDWLKSKKVSAHRVDAGKSEDVVRVAESVDAIVNTTLPRFNLTIMDAAFKAKANYVDLAMYDYSSFLKQLELDDKWKEAGLIALLNAGSSPGITNVLAAHAADRLDRVDEIRIRIFDSVESKEIVSTWSPEVMWDDMATEPVVYDNGELKKVPVFSGEETYNFPDPIDIRGVKVAPRDLFLKLIPPTLSFEEVENKIKAGTLIDAHECYVVEVEGEKAGKKMTYIFSVPFPSLREVQKKLSGATHESYVTGISAAIFTEMVCMGEIKAKGVFLPECLELKARETLIAKLAEKDIEIHEKAETA